MQLMLLSSQDRALLPPDPFARAGRATAPSDGVDIMCLPTVRCLRLHDIAAGRLQHRRHEPQAAVALRHDVWNGCTTFR